MYDLVAFTDLWWDETHEQNPRIEGYDLFQRNKSYKKRGGVTYR